jgi:hypothetical protein
VVATRTVLQHIRPDRIRDTCAEVLRVLAPRGLLLLLCEETRDPRARSGCWWHRTVAQSRHLSRPLSLLEDGYIEEIDRLPGMVSPGEVMLFEDSLVGV